MYIGFVFIWKIYISFQEGSVCWYDGLSCKLSCLWQAKVQFLFFLKYFITISLCSSTVERNTINILIDVQFILRAHCVLVYFLYLFRALLLFPVSPFPHSPRFPGGEWGGGNEGMDVVKSIKYQKHDYQLKLPLPHFNLD